MASSAWGAEIVTNGVFNGSTGWTFGTATYDSTTTRTGGSGSAKVATHQERYDHWNSDTSCFNPGRIKH